jgi:di/tripeptidase
MEEQEVKEKVFDALSKLGRGTAENVIKKIEETYTGVPTKELIGAAHKILANLFEEGKIASTDSEGTIIYALK